jgi:hypothetical protein
MDTFRAGERAIPKQIKSGCPELDLVWRECITVAIRDAVSIPDTEDGLNWHAFLGHAFDLQGSRAGEFVGVDKPPKPRPSFTPLKDRGLGIATLAGLWKVKQIQDHLREVTGRGHSQSVATTRLTLERYGGEPGRSFAEALETFGRIRQNKFIRAFLENCSRLEETGYSFREWLQRRCKQLGTAPFPPHDFSQPVNVKGRLMALEYALRQELLSEFWNVGPALAAYMLSDWQLGLWKDGKTNVFRSFKVDSRHKGFVKAFGGSAIPSAPPDDRQAEEVFADWWLRLCLKSGHPDLPPRLANECIWLGIEKKVIEIPRNKGC